MASTFTKPVWILITSVLLHSSLLCAQHNGGFEEWMPSGSPPPFDWEFPVGWTTNNATTEFTSAGVNPTDDAPSGSLAAHLRTVNVFGTLKSAQLVLGDADLDFANYSVIANTGGEPLAMRPQAVRFYYKLTVSGAFEFAIADVLIKRRSGENIDTLYYDLVGLQANTEYIEVEMPVTLADFNSSTDSIVIRFASNGDFASDVNELFVDDVTIDFTSANNEVQITRPFDVYPNPIQSGNDLHIRIPDHVTCKDIQIINPFGCYRPKAHFNMAENVIMLSTRGMPTGIYYILSGNESVSRFAVFE